MKDSDKQSRDDQIDRLYKKLNDAVLYLDSNRPVLARQVISDLITGTPIPKDMDHG